MLDRFIAFTWVTFVILALTLPDVHSWREWTWDHVDSGRKTKEGKMIPKPGPVGRRGHTLSLVADDIVVLFGGRGPEQLVKHTPRR